MFVLCEKLELIISTTIKNQSNLMELNQSNGTSCSGAFPSPSDGVLAGSVPSCMLAFHLGTDTAMLILFPS